MNKKTAVYSGLFGVLLAASAVPAGAAYEVRVHEAEVVNPGISAGDDPVSRDLMPRGDLDSVQREESSMGSVRSVEWRESDFQRSDTTGAQDLPVSGPDPDYRGER